MQLRGKGSVEGIELFVECRSFGASRSEPHVHVHLRVGDLPANASGVDIIFQIVCFSHYCYNFDSRCRAIIALVDPVW